MLANRVIMALHELGDIDSYVKLMLHMNGTNGSTTFTDSSLTPKTVTAYGNAQISTAQQVFGGASGLFDGNGDYLSVPDSDDWYLGSQDFTIDFRIRLNALPAANATWNVVTQFVDINNRWFIDIYNNNGTNYQLRFIAVNSGTADNLNCVITPTANTWYHYAVVRYNGKIKHFINGSQIGSDQTSAVAVPNLSAPLYIGTYNASSSFLNAYLDELRISKGIARWTTNFTPPAAEYTT